MDKLKDILNQQLEIRSKEIFFARVVCYQISSQG